MVEAASTGVSDKCLCKTCKGIYAVSYSSGACEAVVECPECGQLYYSLLYEQMGFGREDILEEYQIPITKEEFEIIKNTVYKELDLQFLVGREARLIFQGQVSRVDSEFALKRCGR